VTGGGGYVGGYVIAALRSHEHRVLALVRGPATADRVRQLGAEAVSGDVTQPGAWQTHARTADAIVHLAIPGPLAARRAYETTGLSARWARQVAQFEAQALDALFDVARSSTKCRALITTTGPAASGQHGSDFIDEDSQGPQSVFGKVQSMVEERTLAAAREGIAASVLRPGAVYGPDGGFAARILRAATRGKVLYVGAGDNYISWVHIRDYANAYVHALDGRSAGRVVAIVDDEPMRSRDAMQLLAELAGARSARAVPGWIARMASGPIVHGWATQSARMRNTRAKQPRRGKPIRIPGSSAQTKFAVSHRGDLST